VENSTEPLTNKVALITGAAHRVGAAIATLLHEQGMRVIIHYRHSRDAAEGLKSKLEQIRPDSVALVSGDLLDTAALPHLFQQARDCWGRMDLLVNNASSFYPTPFSQVDQTQWKDLLGSNLEAPFFLSQAATEELKARRGSIVNIVDIHADRPLKDFPVYSIAKAGLVMMTRSLARELAPEIRVNAVAPGAILWPEGMEELARQEVVDRTALKRTGSPQDIANAVLYLTRDAHYTTGQVLAVDGGRTLSN